MPPLWAGGNLRCSGLIGSVSAYSTFQETLGSRALRTSRSCGQRDNPLRLTPPVRIQRLDPIGFDFDPNGPLEKTYGDDNPALLAQFDQNAFDARQRAKFDANALAHVQKGPRLDIEPGSHSLFNGGNLAIVDGDWNPAKPNEVQDPGDGQNREPALRVQTAEHITGKQRKLH
jgi:hypothetical protein